jgi:uncharacterized protein involved in exopolysaccharide biosynthesis
MSLSKRYFEQQPNASARLRNARSHVKIALQTAGEGEPTFDTLDEIARSLVAANRELETLEIDVEALLNHERMVN